MIALKFEVRATANNTNMFAEQNTIVEVSMIEKASIEKACMIALGSFATPREMMEISKFLSNNLFTKNEQKFEEITHGVLGRGSYRILAKRV